MSWKYVQRNTETGQYRTTDQGGGGGGSSTFAGLDDVGFSGLQDGQIPKYNSRTRKWENADESGGGGTVTDVEVNGTSVVNQQGVAEITIPTPPSAPVQDVEVDGVSVVNGQGTAEITIPVKDVKVNGISVLDSNKEAQIKSYKEVTLEEYQALPDSKLTDNIMYCIKDMGGANQFPPLIYSTEEREIGVWINGKPVYQKTITDTMPQVASDGTFVNKQINISNLDIEYPVNFIVNMNMQSEGQYYVLPYLNNSGRIAKAFITSNSNDKLITLVTNGTAFSEKPVKITLQYTKTADTAGSGMWTSQGAVAQHYSMTEHVIGTWINGKPLYEKTIDCGYLPNNAVNRVSTGITNAIAVQGFGFCDNGYQNIFIPNISAADIMWAIGIHLEDTGGTLVIRTGADRSLFYAYVTLRYYKTTD